MTLTISAQQGSFYTKNGYLELEGLFEEAECNSFFQLMQNGLDRDLWRNNPPLKELLLSRKMSQLALHLTGKSSLRLACDQWFFPNYFLNQPTKLKSLFSIQGTTVVILIQWQPGHVQKPPKTGSLGLFPFPQGQGNVLIIDAELFINWPPLSSGVGLYAAAYSLPPAVYIQNPSDPAGPLLRRLGYGYGDSLNNETHPLIYK
jgi:hypothetical protein